VIVLSDGVTAMHSKRAVLCHSHRHIIHATVSAVEQTAHERQSSAIVAVTDSTIVKWTAFCQCFLAARFLQTLYIVDLYFDLHFVFSFCIVLTVECGM